MADSEEKVQRINGELHKVTPVLDQDGKVVTHHVQRLHLELSPKDRVQILVGATMDVPRVPWKLRRSPRRSLILPHAA